MKISKNELIAEANRSGYRPEIVEKVILLLDLLKQFMELPFLKERIVLKGGTALNLFCFDQLPRLSVDIDLNYIGSTDKSIMLEERKKLEEAIILISQQNNYVVDRYPRQHAGGKMILHFPSVFAHKGHLEIDLNYMYRIPIWDIVWKDSYHWPLPTKNIPLLDIHELAAGKLHALFSRTAGRDLFDSHQLFRKCQLDPARLRLTFAIYIAMSKNDWRNITVDNINFDVEDIRNKLIPVLQKTHFTAASQTAVKKWAEQLVEECREALKAILPFNEAEQEFLIKLNEEGILTPQLICTEDAIIERIILHPLLQWKITKIKNQ